MVEPIIYPIDSIFAEYKGKVYHLALSILRNDKDAEDILQNTFLKVINNLAQFKNRSKISTWIYRIAYNESLMLLRKRKRQLGLSRLKNNGWSINWAKLPRDSLLDNELKQRIDDSLRLMPIKYRMPLILTNVEGLSLKDVSDILRINVNSLKTRLHRGRSMVKSELMDYLKDKSAKAKDNLRKDTKCSMLITFVKKYADNALPEAKKGVFKRHLIGCSDCKAFLDSYAKAIHITHALECKDIPAELKKRLEKIVLKKQ